MTSDAAPSVTFHPQGGGEIQVRPGGVIGRLVDAALFIDDPRVSEAHAMVSLRAGELVLLALRGKLQIGRRHVARLVLKPGQVIKIVNGVCLTVVEVVLPTAFLALQVDDGPPQLLEHSVYSFCAGELRPGLAAGAQASVWATAEGWRMRRGDEDAWALEAGAVTECGGQVLRCVEQRSDRVGVANTIRTTGVQTALHIVARFETVHIHGADGRSVVVPGIAARIVTELASFGAPVPWEMVARTIWKDKDAYVARRNWDRHLALLRVRLRNAGIRDDLVRPDGRGNVELFLRPGDVLHDDG